MITWFGAAVWRSRTVDRPTGGTQLPYRVLVICGSVLLFGLGPARRIGAFQLWRLAPWPAWILCGVGIAGLVFTWWARLHLGRLWSSSVTRKADHHIVDTGPYGLVRHPIYTGVIVPGSRWPS